MAALGQECHICLEELRRELVAVPCGHVFHHACILQALQVHAQCPICRRAARDADLVALYFDVPSVLGGSAEDKALGSSSSSSSPSAGSQSDETRKLSARVNALMERVQWQKKQSEVLLGELERLRDQNEQLVRDKQALAQRAAALEGAKHELLSKVGKYQMELSRQAEVTRRMTINQSIVNYLNTCDADAIEEEIQNPRELIVALKKACKFRHEQYQKVVKEKMRLKALLQQQQQGGGGQRHPQQQQSGKGKTAAYESKRASPAEFNGGAPSLHFGSYPPESKKRKMDMGPASVAGANGMPTQSQLMNASAFTARSDSAGYRANAYSDVPVRPVMAARHTFGRSNYNPNQYGAYQLTPASDAPVPASGVEQVVCRRGYDETGKLTNFFLPNQSVMAPGMAHSSVASASGSFQSAAAGMQRQKTAPSMRNLLNDDEYAPAIMSSRDARAPANASDRREYTLTSWLRRS